MVGHGPPGVILRGWLGVPHIPGIPCTPRHCLIRANTVLMLSTASTVSHRSRQDAYTSKGTAIHSTLYSHRQAVSFHTHK